MQMEDLIELAKRVQAQQAEAQTVEVKAAHRGCPSKLRDTLSSFSNQNSGGILLFGLDENEHFAAVGVYDLQDLQKKVTEQCNQMQPPVRALFTTAEYEGVFGRDSVNCLRRASVLLHRCWHSKRLLCACGRCRPSYDRLRNLLF